MVVHIVSPEVMKEWIDNLVEKQGVKAFVLSTDMHGTASLPSKKVPLYRIPMCVGENVFRNLNLSRVMHGSRMVLPIVDLEWLSDEALAAMQKKENK